jgi:hypothetical protein
VYKGFRDTQGSGSDSDEPVAFPRSFGTFTGDGASAKGGMSSGGRSKKGAQNPQVIEVSHQDDLTRLPDYSQGFQYEVVRTRRIGSGASHLVSGHTQYDKKGGERHEDEDVFVEDVDHARWASMLFNTIDIDRSGSLSRTEIHLALTRYGFSEAKIDMLFDQADANRDNVLSHAEFNKGMVPMLLAAQVIL